jgi:hypothetical protein
MSSHHNPARVVILALGLIVTASASAATGNEPPREPPYSCRLLYDEQKKCAFGSCDRRVIERLTRECLRDGGRP